MAKSEAPGFCAQPYRQELRGQRFGSRKRPNVGISIHSTKGIQWPLEKGHFWEVLNGKGPPFQKITKMRSGSVVEKGDPFSCMGRFGFSWEPHQTTRDLYTGCCRITKRPEQRSNLHLPPPTFRRKPSEQLSLKDSSKKPCFTRGCWDPLNLHRG